MQSGLDVLIDENFKTLAGQRVGLLCNQASIDRRYRHIVDIFLAESSVNLTALFAPEHGIRGEQQDMMPVEHSRDASTGLPVVSLYGDSVHSLTPSKHVFDDIDTLVVDLQDIGSRYYTFAQTLCYCMMAAQDSNVRIVVLDRINPLGGLLVEGHALEAAFRSFVGYAPVANRHGLTMGELGKLMQRGFSVADTNCPAIACELEVVPLRGWRRELDFGQAGLPWVLPSPNMPSLDTARVYPGQCLFEATNISEGRGTTRPFELVGAPFIDGQVWAEATLAQGVPLLGAALRPTSFLPQFQKHAGKVCHGLQLHVTDVELYKPFRWALCLIAAAAQLYPEEFSWRTDAYEFVDSIAPIDLLFGGSEFRKRVETKKSIVPLVAQLEAFESSYLEARKEYLLY